jgi:hypothetical protein
MLPTQHFLCEAPHTRTAIAGIKWLGGTISPVWMEAIMPISILRSVLGAMVTLGMMAAGTSAAPAFEQTFVNRPPAIINRDDPPSSETDAWFNPRKLHQP